MPDHRLIVGLDVPDTAAARALVEGLGDSVGFYKVGLGLVPIGGLDLARHLKAAGKRVFLDLKLFDIGATVTAAVRALAALRAGLPHRARRPPRRARRRRRSRRAPTRILAVTVLTSLDRGDLDAASSVPARSPTSSSSAPAAPSPPAPTASSPRRGKPAACARSPRPPAG